VHIISIGVRGKTAKYTLVTSKQKATLTSTRKEESERIMGCGQSQAVGRGSGELKTFDGVQKPHYQVLAPEFHHDIGDDYTIKKEIGRGSLGHIDLAEKKVGKGGKGTDSRKYAIKSIIASRVSEQFKLELRNEIQLLRDLDHPNIVKLYSIYVDTKTDDYKLVLQACEGGDLNKYAPYSEEEAARIVKYVCSALQYMHDKHVMHRDLKFENIMFETEGRTSTIKIIDFGLSKKYKPNRCSYDYCGTLYTMSPEIFKRQYTESADMWSVGVIAFMLVSSTRPFRHYDRNECKKKIMCAEYDFNGDGWINKTEEGKDFISKLLVVDARKRLTAKEAYRHTWCQDNSVESERQDRRQSYTSRLTDEEFIELCKKNFEKYAGSCELKRYALNRLAHTCTSEEIRSLHKQFKKFDQIGNGVILKSEFVDTMKSLGYIDEESMEDLFCKLDVFSDGSIQYTEFIAAILEMKGDIADDKIVEVFNQFDVDRSGYITKEVREFHIFEDLYKVFLTGFDL